VLLSIYRQDSLILAEQVTIPAGDQASRTFTGLPETGAIFQASLSSPINTDLPFDAFSLDDRAYVAYQPASPGRTLLVTRGNLFLEQVLAVLPDLTPFRMVPDASGEFTLPPDPFDLLVLDGVYPSEQTLPPGNLLLIDPPSNPLFEVSGTYTVTSSLHAASDPLVSNIDPNTIHIAQASQIKLPTWAKPLLYTDQGPLLFSGETLGRRIAVFCFDLHQSDLPLQVAFPILMAQLTGTLVPPHGIQGSGSLKPAESLEILPPLQVDQVVVIAPSGSATSLIPGETGLLFTQTDELGLYTVNYLSETDPTTEYFAVNLFSELESDIQPAGTLTIGSAPLTASDQNALSMRQLWPWFAAAALILLLLEWWLYHGRLRLPGSRRN
jgi:Ca-activated chloride channel family protein